MGMLVLFPASSEELSGCPECDMTDSTPLATPVSLEITVLCWTVWCCGFASALWGVTHSKRLFLKTGFLKNKFYHCQLTKTRTCFR